MFTILRQRNFGLLWLAGLISVIGDRAMMTALAFHVFHLTGSTLATAAMFAANALPMVLLGSVAGVFVDRWDRRRIMVVTSLVQAAAMLCLLLVQSTEQLWLVYAVVFVETAASLFFGPAENAVLPRLVGEEHLVQANTLNTLNDNIGRLAGPPLGGLLVGLFGLSSVAVFDSATFLAAAALIRLMAGASFRAEKPATAVTAASAWGQVWREWLDGLSLVRHESALLALFAVAAVTSFGGVMFDPLIAPWVQSVLGGDAMLLGWLATAGAIGGLLGGVILARFGGGASPVRLFAFGCLSAGGVLFVMYHLTWPPLVLALALLKSVPLVACNVALNTLFQVWVPDAYRGRVYGAVTTTIALVGLVALGLSGTLGEVVGIVPMLSLAAVITAFAGVLALVLLPSEPSAPRVPDALHEG